MKTRVTCKRIEDIIEFCYPNLRVKVGFAYLSRADYCCIGLEKRFQEVNDRFVLYKDFEEFLSALQMFYPLRDRAGRDVYEFHVEAV